MQNVRSNTIVVGIDGSPGSKAALAWALDLAARRHAPIRLVHAFESSIYDVRLSSDVVPGTGGQLRNAAQRMMDEAAAEVTASHPELHLTTRLEAGPAAGTLIEESDDADTVVVGNRGSGGFADLVVGSTALHVASRAHCTVVAVPAADGDSPGPGVVVGVDGSELSEAAIEYAFRAAAETGEPLTAVHAWLNPDNAGPEYLLLAYHPDLVAEDERLLVAESLAGWSEKYPDVPVRAEVVHEHPAKVLVEAAPRGPAPRRRLPRPRRAAQRPARLGQPQRAAPRHLPGRRRPAARLEPRPATSAVHARSCRGSREGRRRTRNPATPEPRNTSGSAGWRG
jgi:nucleotide-binding universal stress UspA family protein